MGRPRKLTTEQAVEIRARVADGEDQTTISLELNVSTSIISQLVIGKTYKDAGGPRKEPRKRRRVSVGHSSGYAYIISQRRCHS